MSEMLPPGAVICIVGGGQLGRMLAMAAARLGYRTIVLEPGPDCPAAQTANRQIAAAYDDVAALDELASICDVITYEFENVPVAAARRLADRKPVFPPPAALEISQDRLTEKSTLNRLGIATARFEPVGDPQELRASLHAFGDDGVLKTRRLGYDGKGQHLFRKATEAEALAAWETLGDVPLILEELVAFEREISIIAARTRGGDIACYDPAQNIHRGGILHSSTVPARIDATVTAEAKRIAAVILEGLDYVGVIGVEFFVLGDGRLLVNEIAPRVHNSGHWTEAACPVSQFEQHIRCIAGLAAGATSRHSDCVMENLIGEDIARAPALMSEQGVVIHLYGKAEARAGRKMGHFTRLLAAPCTEAAPEG